jgi:hypothetical protein
MRKFALVTVGALGTIALAAGVSAAHPRGAAHHRAGHAPAAGRGGSAATTCTGTLASGDYHRLVVPEGATCDGTAANIDVRGGVRVLAGATFVLGFDGGADTGTIRGGIRAKDPESLQVHFAHIRGGLRMHDGNGFFSTVEDNVIHGGATVDGYSGFWFGFIRNNVHGTVKLTNNVMGDPDANEYVTNTIKGSLVCHGNSPAPQVGDSEGEPNVVSGRKVDQCAHL